MVCNVAALQIHCLILQHYKPMGFNVFNVATLQTHCLMLQHYKPIVFSVFYVATLQTLPREAVLRSWGHPLKILPPAPGPQAALGLPCFCIKSIKNINHHGFVMLQH